MYRFFTALFVLACLTVSSVALADEKACHTPQQMIDRAYVTDKNAIAGRVEADEAANIMAILVKGGVPPMPYDEMVLVRWPNGKATIVLFEKGCATKIGSFPAAILGRDA